MTSSRFDPVRPQFDFKNLEHLPFTVQWTIRVWKPWLDPRKPKGTSNQELHSYLICHPLVYMESQKWHRLRREITQYKWVYANLNCFTSHIQCNYLLKILQVKNKQQRETSSILLLPGLTKKIGNCCIKLKFPESWLEEEEVLPW